jgi:hypothetical protein
MNKRTEVLLDSNTHVAYTAENIADAMRMAAVASAGGGEWQAHDVESYATMVAATIGAVSRPKANRHITQALSHTLGLSLATHPSNIIPTAKAGGISPPNPRFR